MSSTPTVIVVCRLSPLATTGNTSFFSLVSTTAFTLCSASTAVPSSTPTKPGMDFTATVLLVCTGVSAPKA